MKNLWISEDDWLCYKFASETAPKNNWHAISINLDETTAQRILNCQAEVIALQALLCEQWDKNSVNNSLSSLSHQMCKGDGNG